MKTVAVTGGSGFIGSHLLEALNKLKVKVVNVDKVPPHKRLLNQLHQITDLSDVNYRYPYERPDVLFHLAATPWSIINDDAGWFHGSQSAFNNNTLGTFNALREINPQRIVFASTANIYGTGRKLRELSPINITSQYGYSKLIAEEIIRRSGTLFTIFRFGTVVGTRGRCFPNFVVHSCINNTPVEVFAKGQTYRDLVHVDDIVSALLRSEKFEPDVDRPKNTYNVSMGSEVSGLQLMQTAEAIAEDFGYKLNYNLTDFVAPGYVKESTLDISRIREVQGWEPMRDIYSILTELFDYYRHKDSLKPPAWNELR